MALGALAGMMVTHVQFLGSLAINGDPTAWPLLLFVGSLMPTVIALLKMPASWRPERFGPDAERIP